MIFLKAEPEKGGCVVSDKRKSELVKRTREVLQGGFKVAILGWRDSNHDRYTRALIPHGKVVFHLNPPKVLGQNVGLSISTRFIGHSDLQRMKKYQETYPHALTTGEIRDLLEACKDQLFSKPRTVAVTVVSAVSKPITKQPEAVEHRPIPVVLEETLAVDVPMVAGMEATAIKTPILKEEIAVYQPGQLSMFIAAFLSESQKHKDGRVGKNVLGDIRRTCGIKESSSQLAEAGWIKGVVSEGSKLVGSYVPTDKMLQHSAAVVEPTDALGKAKYLVSQEGAIQDEIAALELEHEEAEKVFRAKVSELRGKLEKIEETKAAIRKIEELMK